MSKDEALKLALEWDKKRKYIMPYMVRDALRAALAQLDEIASPQPPEPRNFCPRCGKRTADLTVIHTCTPPRGLEMT